MSLNKNSYIALMGAGAFISISKLFVAASLFSPQDFVVYSVFFSLGSFFSSFLSFGLIESSIKDFPRLISNGNRDAVYIRSYSIFRTLIFRYLLFSISAVPIASFLSPSYLEVILLGFLFALINSAILLLASIQRSLFNSTRMGYSSLLRAILVIGGFLLGYFLFNSLTGAICGEILGLFLGIFATLALIKTTRSNSKLLSSASASNNAIHFSSGKEVYALFLIMSIPLYLDRSIAAALLTTSEAASYSLLAIILSGAILLLNILSQRLGPESIALVKQNQSIQNILKYLWIESKLPYLIILWLLSLAGFYIFVSSNFYPEFSKYMVDISSMILIFFIGLTFVTSLLEFLIIGLDLERKLLHSGVIYLIVYCMTFILVFFLWKSLFSFLVAILVARIIYLLLLTSILSQMKFNNDS